jgi:hypothetical protein
MSFFLARLAGGALTSRIYHAHDFGDVSDFDAVILAADAEREVLVFLRAAFHRARRFGAVLIHLLESSHSINHLSCRLRRHSDTSPTSFSNGN